MKEPNKIINGNELPIAVPPVDQAWEAMRRLLDEDRPEAAPLLPLRPAGHSGIYKYFAGAALIVLLISLSYVVFWSAEKKETHHNPSNTLPSALPENNSNDDVILVEVKKSNSTSENDADAVVKLKAGTDQQKSLLPDKEKNVQQAFRFSKLSSATITNSNRKSDHDRKVPGNKNNSSVSLAVKPMDKTSLKTVDDDKLKTAAENSGEKSNTAVLPGLQNDSITLKNKINNTDSAAPVSSDEKVPHIQLPEEKWVISTGLHWTIPVPFFNSSDYFLGPNGQSQPYRLLLPGVWIQAEKEKQLITLDINPFAGSVPPSKIFRTISTLENNQDTLVQTVDSRSLIKTFGLSAGVGYQYEIVTHWWLGAGVQMHFWKRAVAGSDAEIKKVPIGSSSGVITNRENIYKLTDEWSYFSKIQASINPEIFYKTPKWQAGFRLSVPVTPLAQQDGPKYFLRAELIYRLKLLDIHLK